MSDRDETPAYVIADTHTVLDDALRALMREDYREVMFQLDRLRERASWVEKMMWRRVNRREAADV